MVWTVGDIIKLSRVCVSAELILTPMSRCDFFLRHHHSLYIKMEIKEDKTEKAGKNKLEGLVGLEMQCLPLGMEQWEETNLQLS